MNAFSVALVVKDVTLQPTVFTQTLSPLQGDSFGSWSSRSLSSQKEVMVGDSRCNTCPPRHLCSPSCWIRVRRQHPPLLCG